MWGHRGEACCLLFFLCISKQSPVCGNLSRIVLGATTLPKKCLNNAELRLIDIKNYSLISLWEITRNKMTAFCAFLQHRSDRDQRVHQKPSGSNLRPHDGRHLSILADHSVSWAFVVIWLASSWSNPVRNRYFSVCGESLMNKRVAIYWRLIISVLS